MESREVDYWALYRFRRGNVEWISRRSKHPWVPWDYRGIHGLASLFSFRNFGGSLIFISARYWDSPTVLPSRYGESPSHRLIT
ncbi:unnamed protein product [Acanthoscelides obtectus]|uniref:Uncharacterized protein n=1 Tax=Acanthoscelides obtectus TaxID=200917 RepID=A0A9P0LIA1_ACAOB|nr:unnamed protein product [Acanthoscelides obtectus]CAK1677878.1 hypothetical protein AOBTE_LOCUS31609 [Acanthoscelides obtectus]